MQLLQYISIFLFCSLFVIGCETHENRSVVQTPHESLSPPINVPSSPIKTPHESPLTPVDTSSAPINEKLNPKQPPFLGSGFSQEQFELDDLIALQNGKPRPTSPSTLAVVLAGNPPVGTDVCNLPYSALIKAMYDKCFPEGSSYIQLANIIGYAGDEVSRSENTVVYQWDSIEKGIFTATFVDGKLTSKFQNNLK